MKSRAKHEGCKSKRWGYDSLFGRCFYQLTRVGEQYIFEEGRWTGGESDADSCTCGAREHHLERTDSA
eukprot:6890928-Karenia_brevis.AAC.1